MRKLDAERTTPFDKVKGDWVEKKQEAGRVGDGLNEDGF